MKSFRQKKNREIQVVDTERSPWIIGFFSRKLLSALSAVSSLKLNLSSLIASSLDRQVTYLPISKG